MNTSPHQTSFSAGEISPLMYNRTDTDGYRQGLVSLVNMFADSRGPAVGRVGSRFYGSGAGNGGRVIALPVNDQFFYSGIFLDLTLIISSSFGFNPSVLYNSNANFNSLGASWTVGSDGNASSIVTFVPGKATLETDDKNNRFSYISQEVTVPATGNYRVQWVSGTIDGMTIKIGTTEDSSDIYDSGLTTIENGNVVFTTGVTTFWMTVRVDGNNASAGFADVQFFGITTETEVPVSFVTPYLEAELDSIQAVPTPSGSAFYVLHELHPPYKLIYDQVLDAFSWELAVFTSPPAEWVAGNYPSAGDFFEGRLWLGGTVNEPQTFWASKSGLPEDFTQGVNADDSLQFTMAKYGRIEWMVGFKNLVIGTQNGEHIVTSEGGFIAPDDIQVSQQSAYGSANIQPVQVGDQIFYVSADRRKLRSIQYEWQKDNWLSKDLTFNSEHITESGIRHISWQQNPKNLFHCVLTNGTIATLTYERGHDVYGWSRMVLGGEGRVIDLTTGPIEGTDYVTILVQYIDGTVNFELQPAATNRQFMDSWIAQPVESDGLTVLGLEHLEGMDVQVLVDGATHPDRVVLAGKITLQFPQAEGTPVVVGLQYTPALTTLPMNQQMQSGGSEAYVKRWNKIYIRVLESTLPLINGERAPERQPQTPMNMPQPVVDEEILKVNLGYDRNQTITIEQDLPYRLIVLGVFGEMSQSKI